MKPAEPHSLPESGFGIPSGNEAPSDLSRAPERDCMRIRRAADPDIHARRAGSMAAAAR